MPIDSILPFIIASALLSITPGPDILFVTTQSVLYGLRTGIMITFGLCTGLIFHTAAVVLGIAALIKTSAWAFSLIKYLGAAYLLYLAWQAFSMNDTDGHNTSISNRSESPENTETNTRRKYFRLYSRGIIMNISNPKVSIFFLAFLPQFADPVYGSVAAQIFLLGLIFMIVAFCIFSAVAFLTVYLGQRWQQSAHSNLYLQRISGLIYSVLAIKLLLTRIDQ